MLKIKVFGINVSLDWIVKLLLQLLAELIDGFISGESLSRDQKKAVRLTYYLARDWGEDAVKDTETDLDDEGLKILESACVDTANEGGFALPVIEPL